ncbi:MAG: AAA family ATPase [Nitrospiraceae bacterium]|nr:AAA family ATPase [Nitrospiraceae bacterium]
MKITSLRISNYGILKDVTIHPHSRLSFITGQNGMGKTTILDAVQDGLVEGIDPSMIRKGADKAEILIDLEGIEANRIRTQKSERFSVKVPTHLPTNETVMSPVAAPQQFISKLTGGSRFDPLHFLSLEPKERAKYMRDLFKTILTPEMLSFVPEEFLRGIDYSRDGMEIVETLTNTKNGVIYLERADINKEAAQKKALAEAAREKAKNFDPLSFRGDRSGEIHEKIKAVEHKITEAKTSDRQAKGTQALRDKTERKIKGAEEWLAVPEHADMASFIKENNKKASSLAMQIAETEEKLSDLRSSQYAVEGLIAAATDIQREREAYLLALENEKGTLAALPKIEDVPAIEPLEEELLALQGELEADAAGVALYNDHLDAGKKEADYETKKVETQKLTDILSKLRNELPDVLAKAANMPIPNLKIVGDKIFVGDVPLDRLSTSEKVAFAITITKALNKDKALKTILLDRAESLDDSTLEEFGRQVMEDPEDWQYLLTVVQHGDNIPPGAFVVVDGAVQQAPTDPTELEAFIEALKAPKGEVAA